VLEPLAVRVAGLHADAVGWHGPNQLVALRDGGGDDLEVALAPVDGDLGDGIVGFTAPDAWDAVGAAALGWARPLDADGRPGPREGRVRTVLLVHRSGATASVLWREGGEPELVPGPVEGRIADLLRRAVALPTPPPEGPAELLGSWERTRLACASGTLEFAGIDPALAAWFDEGSFARWVIGTLPRLDARRGRP
jgi:hypothetical protein